jgi:hypothetical protein
MPEKYQRPHWHERVQTIERMKRAQEDERAALAVVNDFNAQIAARGSAWFWPKITTALTARCPWVVIACDSCGMQGDLDLRMKPRDPEASIRVVLHDFRCLRCNGHGRPRVAGLKRAL